MLPRVPIIVVLGATGTGKSKLAIEIAMKYGGEILSADSMQVYKGLDIITNKVTVAERQLARHHMIDYIDPLKRFTVVDYRNQSLAIIDNLVAGRTLPVIVGGTNYYIESLLWKVLVEGRSHDSGQLLMFDRDLVDKSTERAVAADVEKAMENVDKAVEKDSENAIEKDVEKAVKIEVEKAVENVYKAVDIDVEKAVENVDKAVKEDFESPVTANDGVVSACVDRRVLGDAEVVSGRGESGEGMPPKKRVKVEEDLETWTTAELHRKLADVDPEMASRLHPNNRRKIVRSLQVYQQHGKTHSAILQEQRETDGGSDLGGALRYPDSCILWVQCEPEVLNKRLDARVDDMLRAGLVEELSAFHERYNQERLRTNTAPDYTTGIFQSIGFKEFHDYLILPRAGREGKAGAQMLERGVAALKLVTRRYAKKQIKWIVNRFLRRPDRQVPKVFALDATDPSRWNETVNGPAMKIVASYVDPSVELVDVKPLPVEDPLNNDRGSNTCDVCGRVFIGSLQWDAHRASKKHRKVVNRIKRLDPTWVEGDPKPGDP